MELTEEQKEHFLERIALGDDRKQAAEWVADQFEDDTITATRFKFLCTRDATFNRAYQAAQVEGRGEKTDRLNGCAYELALGGHWPALKFLLTTFDDQFAWARSNKVEVSASVDLTAMAAVLTRFLEPAEVDELMSKVEKGMLEEGDDAALPPAA
jgi:hypothetical protein